MRGNSKGKYQGDSKGGSQGEVKGRSQEDFDALEGGWANVRVRTRGQQKQVKGKDNETRYRTFYEKIGSDEEKNKAEFLKKVLREKLLLKNPRKKQN